MAHCYSTVISRQMLAIWCQHKYNVHSNEFRGNPEFRSGWLWLDRHLNCPNQINKLNVEWTSIVSVGQRPKRPFICNATVDHSLISIGSSSSELFDGTKYNFRSGTPKNNLNVENVLNQFCFDGFRLKGGCFGVLELVSATQVYPFIYALTFWSWTNTINRLNKHFTNRPARGGCAHSTSNSIKSNHNKAYKQSISDSCQMSTGQQRPQHNTKQNISISMANIDQ